MFAAMEHRLRQACGALDRLSVQAVQAGLFSRGGFSACCSQGGNGSSRVVQSGMQQDAAGL
jgi:hypothetical protein